MPKLYHAHTCKQKWGANYLYSVVQCCYAWFLEIMLYSAPMSELKTLNQIAHTLTRQPHMKEALQSALAQLIDAMGLETGWIFLIDSDAENSWWGRGYRLVAHCNLPPEMMLGNAVAWQGGCHCQTLCGQDKLKSAYNEVACSRLKKIEAKGLLVHASVPLHAPDRILGILNVAAPSWEAFTPSALELLTNVGYQMGTVIERAQLTEMLQEQRIEEQRALLEFSRQLLGRPNLDDLMQHLVGAVVSILQVDSCALLLPSRRDPKFLTFRAQIGWLSDPVKHRYRIPNDERTGSGRVMRTQRPELIYDAQQTNNLGTLRHDAEVWDWFRVEQFQSAAVVPLVVEGRSIGVLLIDTRSPRHFSENEIRFLQLMANQAAIALENVRLHETAVKRLQLEQELEVSQRIQKSMLPRQLPQVAGWEFAAMYQSARQVGGDFYDSFVLPTSDDHIGLVIADVSDKGVPAALFMALSRTMIRNTALRGHPPAKALQRANYYILEDSWSDMFLTAFYGVLNVANGRFTYAKAGHNLPLWWQAKSDTFEELDADGIVLGILNEIDLAEHEITVAPHDVLVLYTDGVTEALNEDDEEFGVERLKTAVHTAIHATPSASAENIIEEILTAVRAFAQDAPQTDDFTLLVVVRQ